jgi:hypothetical protein
VTLDVTLLLLLLLLFFFFKRNLVALTEQGKLKKKSNNERKGKNGERDERQDPCNLAQPYGGDKGERPAISIS